MKKVFKLKTLVFLLVLVLSVSLFVACDKDNGEEDKITIPEFSINIIDGDDTITLTNEDVKDLDLVDYQKTKKEVTTYYKGFSLQEALEEMDIDVTGIVSVKFTAPDEHSSDLEADKLSTGVLAVFYSETEDGEFQAIGTEKGPVRGFGDPKTDVQQLKTLTIIREEA